MKLFVTGGTGFVGAHFLNAAGRAGHQLRAIRRVGSTPRVPIEATVDWIERGLESVTEQDVIGCDAVVHLAAHSTNAPYDTFENCLHSNVVVAMRFLETCRRAGLRRYVLAGSCFEYGRSAERYDCVPVNAPLEPVTSYPASKAAASVAAIGFAQHHGLELSILRLFQVYGEGEQKTRLWPALREAARDGRDFPMSLGSQVRDFIHVGKVVESFLTDLQSPVDPGRPLVRNVGTGRGQTILEFSEIWWRHWGAKGALRPGVLPLRPSDIMRCVAKV